MGVALIRSRGLLAFLEVNEVMDKKSAFNIFVALIILGLLVSGSVFGQDTGRPEPRVFEKELLKYVKTLSRDVTLYGNIWLAPNLEDSIYGMGFSLKTPVYNQKAGEIQIADRLKEILLQGWLVTRNNQEGPSFFFYPQINNYGQGTVINLVQTELKSGSKFLDLRPFNRSMVGGVGATNEIFSYEAQQELRSLGCQQYYSPVALSSYGANVECKSLFLEFLNNNDIGVVAKFTGTGVTPDLSFCKETNFLRLNGKFEIYNMDVLNKDKTILYGKGYNKTAESAKDIERIKVYASSGTSQNGDVYANWKLGDEATNQVSEEFKSWAQTRQFGCGDYAEDKF